MEQEIKQETKTDYCSGKYGGRGWHKMRKGGGTGAVYCLGFIGAAIYYIQHALTFWAGVIGLLKAAVWPAFLVYHALAYFGI